MRAIIQDTIELGALMLHAIGVVCVITVSVCAIALTVAVMVSP